MSSRGRPCYASGTDERNASIVMDAAQVVIAGIATVVVPLLIAYVGNLYTRSVKEREIQSRYIEIAVDVLRAKPDQQSRLLREWASDAIDAYSDVKLSPDTKRSLVERVGLMTQEEVFERYAADLATRPPAEQFRRRAFFTLKYLQNFGWSVADLKKRLAALDMYGGALDDQLDETLFEAVMQLQRETGQLQDGIFGYDSRRALEEMLNQRSHSQTAASGDAPSDSNPGGRKGTSVNRVET